MLWANNGNIGLGFGFFFFNNKANIFDLVSLAVCLYVQIMVDFLYTDIKGDWFLFDKFALCCLAFRKGNKDHKDGWIKT